jgi:hypothetical protein
MLLDCDISYNPKGRKYLTKDLLRNQEARLEKTNEQKLPEKGQPYLFGDEADMNLHVRIFDLMGWLLSVRT